MDHVWEAGPSDKPGLTRVNIARVDDWIDCKRGSRVGHQLLALIFEQVTLEGGVAPIRRGQSANEP